MSDLIILMFGLLRPGVLIVAAALLPFAILTAKRPAKLLAALLKSILVGFLGLCLAFQASHTMCYRNLFQLPLGGILPFVASAIAYAVSFGYWATDDVRIWQQLSCLCVVPLLFVAYPVILSRGGEAGFGAAIITLLMLPSLLALVPAWLLGWLFRPLPLENERRQ